MAVSKQGPGQCFLSMAYEVSLIERHYATDLYHMTIWKGLCGASMTLLFLEEKPGNHHEVVCENCRADQQLKVLAPLSKTALHPAPSEQNGDSPFDTGPEALSFFEGWALLMGSLLRASLSAALRNAHDQHAGILTLSGVGLAVKSSIGAVNLWSVTEHLFVMLERRLYVRMILRISTEHAILSDEASGTLGNEDFVAKLDRLSSFAPLDQICVGFKDRKDLCFVGNLLTFEYAAACLIYDPVAKLAVVINLSADSLDPDITHQINAANPLRLMKHVPRVFYNLRGGPDELAVFLCLLPLSRTHSVDLLHPAPRAARSLGETLHSSGKQIVEIFHEPCDDPHSIPQQAAIRWVVNVGFDDGRVNPQFLAVFQSQGDSRFDDDFVDRFKRCRGEPVKSPVKSVMLGNELAVETSESPQGISVCDPFAQFAVIPVLDPHQSERAQHLLCAQPVPPDLGIFQATLQVAAYLLDQVSVLVDKVGDRLQHRLQAHALAEEFEIGKTSLGDRGSCHFLTF